MLPSPGESPDRGTERQGELENGEGGKDRAGGDGSDDGHEHTVVDTRQPQRVPENGFPTMRA